MATVLENLETEAYYTNSEVTGLVCAAQDGDREAFGELVERFERTIYAIAFRRLTNHAEAQELCQEVFVQALEKLDQLRQPECFPGWLTPIRQIMATETRRQVRAGLRQLGSLDRKTLEAFYVRGQSLLEMSDEFDAPVGTIKRRLHVARKRLAAELAELAPA
jgi:RNA polymerase sigma-70 factor, ECF subfamily